MGYSDAFLLTLANIGLGLVVLICCLLIGREVLMEVSGVLQRRGQRQADHPLRFPVLRWLRRVPAAASRPDRSTVH